MADLKEILKAELIHYAGQGANCFAFPIFDDEHQTYSVNVVVSHPQTSQRFGGLCTACG